MLWDPSPTPPCAEDYVKPSLSTSRAEDYVAPSLSTLRDARCALLRALVGFCEQEEVEQQRAAGLGGASVGSSEAAELEEEVMTGRNI